MLLYVRVLQDGMRSSGYFSHDFCPVCLLICAEKHFVISTLYPFVYFLFSNLSHPTYVIFQLSVLCMTFVIAYFCIAIPDHFFSFDKRERI